MRSGKLTVIYAKYHFSGANPNRFESKAEIGGSLSANMPLSADHDRRTAFLLIYAPSFSDSESEGIAKRICTPPRRSSRTISPLS